MLRKLQATAGGALSSPSEAVWDLCQDREAFTKKLLVSHREVVLWEQVSFQSVGCVEISRV